MSSVPFLKSKLILPELSESFLLTDRMKKLHKSMDSCKAVSICAPAGYGKTTLAVSYFAHQAAMPFRICWYRLDSEDKNLSVFTAHLSEALFPSEDPGFADVRKSLGDCADTGSEPDRHISILCRKMWEYHGRDGHTRTYLVLDDFQNVAQVHEICEMTRYLLDNLPPSCSLFILNRSNLSVFSEKQKLEHNILELDMSDLAFSGAEIEELVFRMDQNAADRRLNDFIEENTEGWIAGVIILYHAVKSRRFGIAPMGPGNLDREDALFRYLSLEVLKSVDHDAQDALARLALLQDFSEAEASEIFEIDDIKTLIGQCLGFGMFIQRIPGNPVVYRFHSLFREFLLTVLRDRRTAEQVADLHLKAAEYYMKRGIFGRVAVHLAKCGSSDSAMELVSRKGFNKYMIGETAQLKLWLDLLPEDMIRDNPVLLLFQAQLMPNSKQPEIVEKLKEVLRLSRSKEDIATYYDAATVLIYIFMCSNDMKSLVEMAAGIPGSREKARGELENALVILDIVRSIGEDRFTEAEAQSESVLYATLPEDSQWLYLILSCIVYFCLGKLDQGERCMRTALTLTKFRNIEPSRGFILLFLSIILTLKNERDDLSSYIAEVLAVGEKYNYEYLSGHGNRLVAIDSYLSFQTEAAGERMEQAVFFFQRIGNRALVSACRLFQRLWTLRPGGPAPDLEEAQRDVEIVRKAGPGMLIYENALSVFGAIAREAGDFSLAERSLLSAIELSGEKKGWQLFCGSLFHLSRLYYAKGDAEQGRDRLRQALELASGRRYFMFWDVHIPTLVESALRGIRYGCCADYAEELLRKFYSGKTVRYLSEKGKTVDESEITAFVDHFVSTYKADQQEPLYLVKASLFGKPEIWANGARIPDSEWKTKKVKALLEYLLLHSGNTVSKKQLAELLWPEADSRAATASLRTALYHLRKILFKHQVEVAGKNAFLQETMEGLQIRRDAALELDMHEFLRLYHEFTLFPKQTPQTDQRSMEFLKRVIQIYKGDLMEGSDYGDVIFHERERMKSIFMEACRKLSGIYMEHGELQQAEEVLRRAFAAEPYDETICLKLLELYMAQGRKSKAVKLYYSFKKSLEQELDVKIDNRLTEAIRSPKPERERGS